MLTTRERKILELLYRNEKALTTAEIANSLHISTRTIKSDIPKIKEESLIQSFTELIKELDIVLTKAEDENSRQTIKFCQSRIIEILSNNGVESMEKDSIFDSTRHIPVPFKIVPNGTPIANIERIGLIYAGKVVLKAQVNI